MIITLAREVFFTDVILRSIVLYVEWGIYMHWKLINWIPSLTLFMMNASLLYQLPISTKQFDPALYLWFVGNCIYSNEAIWPCLISVIALAIAYSRLLIINLDISLRVLIWPNVSVCMFAFCIVCFHQNWSLRFLYIASLMPKPRPKEGRGMCSLLKLFLLKK